MKITGWKLDRISVALKTPFITSLRRLDAIENIILTINSDTPFSGQGGAAPTAVITGDTFGSITAGIEHIMTAIMGMEIENIEGIMQRIQTSMVGNSSAKAAVDMAVYDLYGKLYSAPLYRLLGGARDSLTTDITISLNEPEEMASDSVKAAEEGFSVLKIKLGKDAARDFERIKAVRDAVGPSVSLRIDANQGWTPKDAVGVVARMERAGINPELIEQPVAARDFEGMCYVRERIPFPLVADESLFSPKDAIDLVKMHAADGFNIKLMKSGGICNAMKIAAIAESAGLFCMVGSMMESHTGLTAAAHFAASRAVVSMVDLDVPLLCAERKEHGGTEYTGSSIRLPEAAGLGLD
ncbi:dipeptide epimerase [Sediminispirochaeta bajacaliforniensis]|uniref:dipeptide epimerase n=1 Tax=Sediminispirochaeta bajacaliforniensis TaxID=148 RepID=UPI000379765D|nr:dipeptide epimerase [Sediminispirochaeta bajacaliforniensis]